MLIAILFYVGASIAVIVAERRLARFARVDPTVGWLNEHVYTPVLRALTLELFIVIAYPGLFGIESGPSLGELLRGGKFDVLVTSALALSLLLPLVPGIWRLPGAVLATQGILSCCLLFGWLAHALGHDDARLWMGWPVIATVVAVLIAGRLAARAIVSLSPRQQQARSAPIVIEAMRLASEIPAIALYGWALGRQLVDSSAI